jgi:Tol biopolymer transport system component
VAFLSNRAGNLDIFTIDADGQNLQALTTNEVDELEVIWGPDGRLVFVSQLSDKPDLFIMKESGADQRALPPLSGLVYTQPDW